MFIFNLKPMKKLLVLMALMLPMAFGCGQEPIDENPQTDEVDEVVDLVMVEDNADNYIIYMNEAYGYFAKYPSAWSIGFFGEEPEKANPVWFVSKEDDLVGGDGGLPQGAKIQVFVQNLAELEEVDESFPEISVIDDWVNWEKENQASIEDELNGPSVENKVELAGVSAIRFDYNDPENEYVGSSVKIEFLGKDKENVYVIQYFGSEPDYTEQMPYFEKFIEDFSF